VPFTPYIFETEVIMNQCPPLRVNHCCCICAPGHNIDRECSKIIASVALIEASIAHILNAEGEKIQRMLEISDCPYDILSLNRSVNDVIIQITHLERILCEKLALARAILKDGSSGACAPKTAPQETPPPDRGRTHRKP
jgi:hypothetical protein